MLQVVCWGGAIASPRIVLRGDLSQEISPVLRVCKHLRLMGLQQIPESEDRDPSQSSGRIWDPGEDLVVLVMAPSDIHSGTMVEEHRSDPVVCRSDTLCPRRRVDYRDNR